MEFKSIPPLDAGLTAAAAANGCVARRLQQNIAAALAVICTLAHLLGICLIGSWPWPHRVPCAAFAPMYAAVQTPARRAATVSFLV